MKFFYKTKLGFTLVEILVSISIFLIVFFITMANFRYSQKSNDFKLRVFDIEDSIRATQNMSLTGDQINGVLPTNGYGINFNIVNNTYTIYGDKIDTGNVGALDSQDLLDSTFQIEDNISIKSVVCDPGGPLSTFDILFYPPRANVVINNDPIYAKCYIRIDSENVSGCWIVAIDAATSRVWSYYLNSCL